MRSVRVQFTPALFREVVPFPIATKIVGARVEPMSGNLELTLEHPELPDLAEGDEPPLVRPTFKRNVLVEFVEWGLS